MAIKDNLKEILKDLSKNITLVGVTKYSNREEIEQAIKAGLKNIGENRIDSIEKIKRVKAKKHFIGNIQSNKIKIIVENFDIIQSVRKLEHLVKIDIFAVEFNKNVDVLLQIKVSNDLLKKGIKSDKISDFFGLKLKRTNIIGFMMMASNTDDKEQIKKEFLETKALFDIYKRKYNLKYLSMGMSGDYKIALKCGSNMIRIGSAIFKY